MTNEEIYADLKEKTKALKLAPRKKVGDIEGLCYCLIMVQLSQKTIEETDFYVNEEKFRELFENFSPRGIVGHGRYLDQLKRVLDVFKPERSSSYKKLTQSVFLTAKYLSRYSDLNEFLKDVYLECIDDKSTFSFLMDYRLSSGLSSMYFTKTCAFFENAGILDVPVLTPKAKGYLLPLTELPDMNEKLYFKMISISQKNHISLYELNSRIEAL